MTHERFMDLRSVQRPLKDYPRSNLIRRQLRFGRFACQPGTKLEPHQGYIGITLIMGFQ